MKGLNRFIIDWDYDITKNQILQLLYKYWVKESSWHEIKEDALALTNGESSIVAESLADYVAEIDPLTLVGEALKSWKDFKYGITEGNSNASRSSRELPDPGSLLSLIEPNLSLNAQRAISSIVCADGLNDDDFACIADQIALLIQHMQR